MLGFVIVAFSKCIIYGTFPLSKKNHVMALGKKQYSYSIFKKYIKVDSALNRDLSRPSTQQRIYALKETDQNKRLIWTIVNGVQHGNRNRWVIWSGRLRCGRSLGNGGEEVEGARYGKFSRQGGAGNRRRRAGALVTTRRPSPEPDGKGYFTKRQNFNLKLKFVSQFLNWPQLLF